nr:TfpX/TfpZ family type IV pilin accessory protein [uncultured Rhodoferax sp.]
MNIAILIRNSRWRASAVHLSISMCVAVLSAFVVFLLWYPYPYREISGGRELFLLMISVDVVTGPLITLVIFSPHKSWRELRKDMVVVALLQFAALAYGVWSVFEARPVQLVYEYGRFSVISAAELDPNLHAQLPEGVNPLPWNGPGLVALREFQSNAEKTQATLDAFAGVPLGARMDLWQPYAQAVPEVLREAKSASDLLRRFPQREAELIVAMRESGLSTEQLRYLPLVGRKSFWTVLIHGHTGYPVGFIALDSF